MFLTYRTDKFILENATTRIAEKLKNSSAWVSTSQGGFETTDFRAAAKLRRVADQRAEKILDRAFVKYFDPPAKPLPTFLDAHQKEGVLWVLTRSRSYLAHAPGAGKTAQAIVAAQYAWGAEPALFIVPPTLTFNWAREIIKWTDRMGLPEYWPSIAIIPETAGKDETGWDAEFIICPDSMLAKPWVIEALTKRDYRLIAVDEASRFKEPTSARTIALFGGVYKIKGQKEKIKSTGLPARSNYTVLLDGSPMPNRPMELWAPTYAMAPEAIDFMSQQDFGFRYCGARMNDYFKWEFKGASAQELLKSKLQEKFMHVVNEDQLNHPERKRSMIFMNEDARSTEHKTWEQKHLGHMNIADLTEDESSGELARFRRELGLNKVPWIARYVLERIAQGESVLLFAWHREVCLRLRKAFGKIKPGIIMGGTLDKEREYYFDKFQRGATPLIIGNIASMGRGHNLQRANRVVFGEFSWTDELNKQCEKRASRKGNEQAVTPCDYIVSPNSMDEVILTSVFTKARNVKRVIG